MKFGRMADKMLVEAGKEVKKLSLEAEKMVICVFSSETIETPHPTVT